jgi:hypothetical protein
VEAVIFIQTLNPGKGSFTQPYDSTQGVGSGFYWFAFIFLMFIAGGVLKAFWDDPEWRVRIVKNTGRPRKFKKS